MPGVCKWGRPTGNDSTAGNWLTLSTEGKNNIKVWLVPSSFSFCSFELEFCNSKLSRGGRRDKWKTAQCKKVCSAKDGNNSCINYELNMSARWLRNWLTVRAITHLTAVLRCVVAIVSPFRATRLVERKVRKTCFARTWVFCGLCVTFTGERAWERTNKKRKQTCWQMNYLYKKYFAWLWRPSDRRTMFSLLVLGGRLA